MRFDLVAARERHEISQRTMATWLGVSNTFISYVESEQEPCPEWLHRAYQLLGELGKEALKVEARR